MRIKLEASFTVEAAFVMTIIFLSMATVITSAYKARDRLVQAFTIQESALDSSRIEDAWMQTMSSLEKIEAYANAKIHKINRLSGNTVDAQNTLGRGKGILNTGRAVSLPVHDPENRMRKLAPVSEMLDDN